MILQRNEDGSYITPCRECIFAEFRENPEKELNAVQTGCKFNRPDKFKNRGTKVDWIEDKYVSYHSINVFCNCIRDREWQKNEKIELNDMDGAIKRVTKDNEVRWSGIILCEDLTNLDTIKKSLDWMLSSRIQPESIVISLKSKEAISNIQELREFYKENKVPLFFNRCLEITYEREPLDQCALKCNAQYYVAVQAGYTFDDLIEKFNTALFDCKLIGIIKEQNLLVCHAGIHKALGGNKGDFIETKVVGMDEKHSHNIFGVKDL